MNARSLTEPASAPTDDPLVGTEVGGYRIEEVLAVGGAGVVYRGVHPRIKKRVAVKVLKETDEPGRVELLAKEAEAVNSIGHRNIVDIFGIGTLDDGRPYVVMELLEGQPLDVFLAERGGKLPLAEALALLAELCVPLAAAHQAQLIHRDLKPSNVFVCTPKDGPRFLKLLDFGLAKRASGLGGVTEQTSRTQVSGTPDFMAPEHAQGKAVSARTDLYALGCIAFQLVTGRLPFEGETAMDKMMAHVRAPVPHPRELEPNLPEPLDALICQLLAKKPDARPATAEEVRARLEALLQEANRPATKHLPTERVLRAAAEPPPRSTRGLVVAGAIAAGALLVVTATVLLRQAPRSTPPAAPPDRRFDPLPPVALPSPPPQAPTPSPSASPSPTPADPPRAEPKPPPSTQAKRAEPKPSADLKPAAEPKPTADVKPAPSTDELRARLGKLEQRLHQATPAGADADPAALQYLAKYRLELTMAEDGPARVKLAKLLDQWERMFLPR